MNKIKQYLQPILSGQNGQGMMIYGIFLLVGVIAVIGLGIKTAAAYRESVIVSEQKDTMIKYIDSYNNLANKINKARFKAVSEEQLDNVQSEIIMQVQAHNLQLIKLNSPGKNDNVSKIHGKTYELTVLGAWADTFHFIDQLGSKDALISERYISMKPDKSGQIQTVIEYKVYVK